LWSLRSRPSDDHFKPVRRDAIVFLVSLVTLCVLSVGMARKLPPIKDKVTISAAKPVTAEQAARAAIPAAGTPVPATPTAPPIARVARPWQQGQPELGVNVYWAANPDESQQTIATKVANVLNYVVSLGANSVSVSFPFVTTGISSNELRADPGSTPSIADLSLILTEAKAAGLHVSLRPILNEDILVQENANAWRGSISPSNVALWFQNYTRFLTPYVQLAQSTGTNAFYVSTELTSMEAYSTQWAMLVTHLDTLYSGTLSASVNYNRLTATNQRIPGTELGVDAYFPLTTLDNGATVQQIAAGWNQWLNGYSTGQLSDLEISEAGIVPYDGAYHAPFALNPNGIFNENIQTSWYEAACQVAQTRGVAGLYWWYLNLDSMGSVHDPRVNDPMSFYDTSTAQVVKNCFASYPR